MYYLHSYQSFHTLLVIYFKFIKYHVQIVEYQTEEMITQELLVEYKLKLENILGRSVGWKIQNDKYITFSTCIWIWYLDCGIPNREDDNRIIGGIKTEIGEYPWQVSRLKTKCVKYSTEHISGCTIAELTRFKITVLWWIPDQWSTCSHQCFVCLLWHYICSSWRHNPWKWQGFKLQQNNFGDKHIPTSWLCDWISIQCE